jgi:hypothetical protein
MGSNDFYFAKNSCEKLTIIIPTHNRAARVLDPLSIAAASSHFDVNVDSDDDNDVYDPIGIKHYVLVKVNIVYYLLILKIFGTFFGRFVAAILFFSKLDFGFLISDLKNPYIHIFTEIDKFFRIMASFSAFQRRSNLKSLFLPKMSLTGGEGFVNPDLVRNCESVNAQ